MNNYLPTRIIDFPAISQSKHFLVSWRKIGLIEKLIDASNGSRLLFWIVWFQSVLVWMSENVFCCVNHDWKFVFAGIFWKFACRMPWGRSLGEAVILNYVTAILIDKNTIFRQIDSTTLRNKVLDPWSLKLLWIYPESVFQLNSFAWAFLCNFPKHVRA